MIKQRNFTIANAYEKSKKNDETYLLRTGNGVGFGSFKGL